MFVTYNWAFTTKMLVLKKTFSSYMYTSSRMPEGTVNMFIIRHLLQKCWCSRRLSQATPPVGCLKAQFTTCFNSYNVFYYKMLVLKKAFPSYTSCRMSEGTGNIYILLFPGIYFNIPGIVRARIYKWSEGLFEWLQYTVAVSESLIL